MTDVKHAGTKHAMPASTSPLPNAAATATATAAAVSSPTLATKKLKLNGATDVKHDGIVVIANTSNKHRRAAALAAAHTSPPVGAASAAVVQQALIRKMLNVVWRTTEVEGLNISKTQVAVVNKDAKYSTGYGEPTLGSAEKIFEKMRLRPCTRFIDLGSGSGKMVLGATVLLSNDCVECKGVEILTARVIIANEKHKRTVVQFPHLANRLNLASFHEGDICTYPIDAYSHIFVFGSVFSEELMDKVIKRLSRPEATWTTLAFVHVKGKKRPDSIGGAAVGQSVQITMVGSGEKMTCHFYDR